MSKRIANLTFLEASTSVVIYLRNLGIEIPDISGLTVSIPCPLPHQHDNGAQLIIYRNGRVKCTSSDEFLSIWDIAMLAEGLRFPEAVHAVCDVFSISDQIETEDTEGPKTKRL